PTFWAGQITRPVLFADALDAVAAEQPGAVLLECGPGRTLTALARQHSDVRSGRMRAVPTLPARRADPADERRSVLQAAAVLWTGGRTLDWAALEGGTPVHRTPMPGYPYQRERFWIDAEPVVETPVAALEPVVQVADGGPVSAFSVLAFAESSPSPSASARHGTAQVLALLPADRRCAADLAALLWQVGMEVVPVWPGDGFARTGAGFQVRPGSVEDFQQLFGALADPGRAAGYPELIVHAWTADDPERWDLLTLTDRLDRGFHSLLTAIQQGARQAAGRLPDLLVLTTRSVDVSGAEEVDPARAMLHGLVRTLALEEPRTSSALIDIGVRVDKSTLTAAIGDPARPVVSALRGNRRWVRVERPFDPTPSGQPVLRRRGSYLLTGGLGGLGLAIAKGLARSGLQPKLVLLGRHGPTADALAVLAELESMGAEVHTVTADVTDAEALAAVVKETGPFQGVFHLAGVRGNGMLHVRDRADAMATLAPKVHGTAALVEVFAREPALDLFVGFGSRAAIDGLIGGGDYAAANAFLASVAENGLPGLAALSGRTGSIDWPSWTRVGMAVESLAADRGRREQSQGVRRWQTVLSVESYAALDEHRLGPTAVLPGTGPLDPILRAFRAPGVVGDERPVRLSDVFFRQPLAVPHECQLEVTFEPDDGGGWTFQVRAAATGAGPDGPWTEHVSGRIGHVDAEHPHTDVGVLLAALPERAPCTRDDGLFTLGPRWDLDPQINSAPGADAEPLLPLTLPDVFADEAADHELHPTLLDAATSSTRLRDEPGHLPLMYRELTVYKRLTPRLLSHIRRREAADGLLVADIDLLSPDGAVLVRIGGDTMGRIPENGLSLATPAVPGPASALAPAANEVGIPPQIGVDLLFRILDDLSPRARIAVRPFRGGQP